MNYYKRHIGDYMKDASHLSLLEHGIYMRLLDVYYTREAAIPVDQAARLIGARSKDEKEALLVIASEFFQEIDGAYVQTRCEMEIGAMQQKAETNREAGKRGGRPKRETAAETSGNPEITQMVSEKNPNETLATSHKPITNNQEEGRAPRKRSTPAACPECPDDVNPQVWSDWLALRKQKKAPVTETVLSEAEKEAAKAGLGLEAFLRVWCARGSQGLSAEWLKPNELSPGRGQPVNKQEALEQRGQVVVDEWANEGAAHAAV